MGNREVDDVDAERDRAMGSVAYISDMDIKKSLMLL